MPQLTADFIEGSGRKQTDPSLPKGCFRLNPPLMLRDIRNGNLVHALFYDESGHYPGTIALLGCDFWWYLELFEVADAAAFEAV